MAEVRHNKGEAGGYLVGRRHSNGGIQAVNKSTGQPLEMEGGEVVITRDAVSDSEKRSFNGKMMTNRQILSEINQSGGGVAFADGGEVPDTMHFTTDAEYEYGGKTMCGCDLATEMSKSKSFEDGGPTDLSSIASSYIVSVEYKGFEFSRYSKQNRETIDSGSLVEMLTEILRDASKITDKYLEFNLDLKIVGKNEETFIPLRTKTTYQSVIDEGGFEYSAVLQEFQDTISNYSFSDSSPIKPNTAEISYVFYEQNKMYFLGIEGDTLGSKDPSIYPEFRQDNFLNLPSNGFANNTSATHLMSFDDTNYVSEVAKEKSNYKDWEKVVRSLNKKIVRPDIIDKGKAITALALTGYVRLASLRSGSSNRTSRVDAFLSTGKPMVTKWSWWKKNLFEKTNFYDYFDLKDDFGNTTELKLTFSDVDFIAYEQEFGSVKPNSRSMQKRNNILSIAREDILNKADEFTLISSAGKYADYLYSPSKFTLTKIEEYGKFDIDVFGDFGDDLGSFVLIANQAEVIFIGVDGLFFFNRKGYGRTSFILRRNEAAAKAAAALQATIKDAQAAAKKLEKQAQLKAEEEEKLRKEALRNREFKVRDQPEDFEFFDYEDLSDDNYKSKSEREALVTMLKIAKGPKNFAIRKVILKKISKIDKQLEEQRMSSAGNDGIDVNKLLTPKGLMDYYFNQTRQSPVKKMNEPCDLPTPTGAPSKLSLQAYNAVRTRYFKRWFGDWELAAETDDYTDCSKIVDPETKEPIIMYHGVRKYDSRVDVANTGKGIIRPYAEFKAPNFPATYFGSDQSYVEFYAGMAENQPHPDPNYEGFVYYVFLNMRNPIYIDALGISKYSYDDLLAYIAIQYGLIIEPSQAVRALVKDRKDLKPWNYVRRDLNLIAELKKAGFDGIVQVGNVPAFTPEGQLAEQDLIGDEYLIFDANQVKSAVVKNSFYVPMIDDIRFKDGGYVRI